MNYFLKNSTVGFKIYSEEYAELITKWINDSEINIYFELPEPQTKEKTLKCINNLSHSSENIGFVIFDILKDKPIGIIEIRNISHLTKKCSLEIALGDKKYHGRGYGFQTMLLAEEYIFEILKLQKCTLHTFCTNQPMIKLSRKMGYVIEGILKNEAYKNGEFIDELIFSKFKQTKKSSLKHIPSSVLELIGNTPAVEFKRINKNKNIRLFGKLEFYNPSGSVKDRAAYAMIQDAEAKGRLNSNTTIIECTSGNTGIGLAMVSAIRGYKCILVAPEGVIPLGKKSLMQALGAKLIQTPIEGDYELSIEKAEELAREIKDSYVPHQFENEINPEIHQKTTALEILQSFGSELDYIVSAVGSGGTITGVARVIKKYSPSTKIVAVEPENCAALSGGKIGEHFILGIGAGFVPKIIDRDMIDEIITVKDEEAAEYCMKLAREEGIFCGISSGAAVCGALKLASKLTEKNNILVFIPDYGTRYVGKKGFFMDYFDKYVAEHNK